MADIGTLTGQVSIEDQVSDHLTELTHHILDFAKEAMDGFSGVAIAIGAVSAAAIGAAVSIEELGKEGSKILGVERAFDNLAEQAGTTGDALRHSLTEGVKGTITEFELMQASSRLMASGFKITEDNAYLLGAASRALGKATGTDAVAGLEGMSRALATGQTRLLKRAGILVDTTKAEYDLAKSLNVSTSELSSTQKLEATRGAILQATQGYLDRLGESQVGFGERIKITKVALEEWHHELGKAIASSPVLAAAMSGLGSAIVEAFGGKGQKAIDTIMIGVNHFAVYVVDAGIAAVEAARVIHVAWSVVETVVLAVETAMYGLVSAAMEVGAEISALNAKMAPWSDEAKQSAQHARELADAWNASTDSLEDQTKEAARGIIGQSKFDQTLDHLGGTLMNVRDQAITAMNATKDHTNAVKHLGEQTKESAELTEAQQKKLNEQIAENARIAEKIESDKIHNILAMNQYAGERAMKEAEDNYKKDQEAARVNAEVLRKIEADRWKYQSEAMNTAGEKALEEIKKQYDRVAEYSFNSLGSVAADAKKDYDYVVANSKNFSRQAIQHFKEVYEAAQDAANGVTHEWLDTFKSIAQAVPGLIQQAFTGGGGLIGAAKAAGSMIGSQLGGGLVTHMEKDAPEFMGKALGKMIGSAIPLIGGIAGPLIGKLVDVFSGGAEHIINPVRQAFVDMAGGLDALNRKAHDAGVTLTAMLDAKNPEQYKKAIDDLNAAFQFQDQSMKFLDDTVKKYGLSISQLGPAFAQQELDKQAADLTKEFRAMEAAQIDIETVTTAMSDNLNSYFQDALKTGATIPESMHPLLHQLAVMGELYDDAGNKVSATQLDGMNFSQTMTEATKSLTEEIKKLTDAITRGLGTALKTIPNPVITGTVHWNVDPVPSGAPDTQGYATGGIVYAATGFAPRGTDTVPAMLTPGERVLTVQENRMYESQKAGGGSDESDNMRHLMQFVMPGLLADAMVLAMVKSGFGR